MRLAIVHYHLRKGGVTRVIASALEALGDKRVQAVVIASTEPEEQLPCPVAVVPALAYSTGASRAAASALHAELVRAAEKALGGPPDIWHIHNHCLGKSAIFPEAVRLLIADGARLLLQIHDFAEDGRPGNYRTMREPYATGIFSRFAESLYPVAPQIGYAVLNGRDRRILSDAGVPADQLFWLPNAVTMPPLQSSGRDAGEDRPLILYPTRAIRRKNLGELLLMAACFPQFRFATTLSPKNPQWAETYQGWVDLARELNLPVEFALGERSGNSFDQLVGEAAAMVTTSVGEGFGLAFLEPWLMGKPVCGRDLPEITGDFLSNGIALPDLYPEWRVPLGMIDPAGFHERLSSKISEVYAAYGRSISRQVLERDWEQLCEDDLLDFGILDETAQAKCLRAVAFRGVPEQSAPPVNPDRLDRSVISANAAKIGEIYGLRQYGQKLMGIYDQLLKASPADPAGLDSDSILGSFLEISRFRFLRT